ncbi:hypothetical protein KP79_PYT21294 [Mizuhopecten yessoensis]|uniref:SGNH hydrolase-type esterase domain-containing protein n=1 Tax=Mizuhopecten yessoensis TaxID=6573 RepID=A0A210PL24_MIZYE|nr:hypothetical protein KP79_PYT21294 [Mizuhopecten yessoensis]
MRMVFNNPNTKLIYSQFMKMKKTALVLGHSFTRRLAEWAEKEDAQASPRFNLHVFGVGGRRIRCTLTKDTDIIRRLTPDIVFLQIGSNDISRRRSAKSVAEELNDMATYIRMLGVQHVIVGSLFPRPRPRQMTQGEYHKKRRKINHILKMTSNQGIFTFWNHAFMKNKFISHDGVHLTIAGNKKFYFSIQTAIHRCL